VEVAVAIMSIPSSSREYVRITVAGDYTTSMPVDIALVPYGVEPDDDDWTTAAWAGGAARLLIGPGSTFGTLDEGDYGAWVRVTTAEEQPVIYSGIVKIT
jgi:hypothetical protein